MTGNMPVMFSAGDRVEWVKYDPESFMKKYGEGPFVVAKVETAEGFCPHNPSHKGYCGNRVPPPHPQLVTVNYATTGKRATQFTGAHLKKV